MTFIEKMNLVDELTYDISEKIGMLTRQGVFAFDEGVNIIKIITDAQIAWLKNSFTEEEYREYMGDKTG